MRQKTQPEQTARLSVGFANKKVFPPSLPLNILFDSAIQMIYRIRVNPILVYARERIIGSLKADFGEVCNAL